MNYINKIVAGLFFVAGLASSCSRKVCPPSNTIVKDSIVYRDREVVLDPIAVQVKRDSARLKDTILELPKDLQSSKTVTNGKTKASYSIKDRIVTVDCDVSPYEDTIRNLKAKIQEKESYHSSVTTVEKPVEIIKYKAPGWMKIMIALELLGVFIWVWSKGWLTSIFSVLSNVFKRK